MPEPKYNDPFYFALPAGGRQPTDLTTARGNLTKEFGVKGRIVFVSRDASFDLFKVVGR